ncbi:hypothetical protein L1887_39001 [Cichorium endivia]|nr:hypothetical protein L1887_39001 [Cichorium endivia]
MCNVSSTLLQGFGQGSLFPKILFLILVDVSILAYINYFIHSFKNKISLNQLRGTFMMAVSFGHDLTIKLYLSFDGLLAEVIHVQ